MPEAFHPFFLTVILASISVWSGWSVADEKSRFVFEEDEEAPPGFENIDAARETEVEIWFRDRKVGATQAEFTSSWIRFSNAAKVVGFLPDILNAGAVSAALEGKISANESFICHQDPACPIPEPEIASVVFDARYFRAKIYINPAYLSIKNLNNNRYLGSASTGFSAIQGLSLSMSGARAKDSTDHYSWYGRSVMAFQENHIFSDWNYDKTEHANISSLYLERDLQGQEIQGGLFRGNSFGLSFSADPLLLGGRIAHSSETLTQNAALNVTPLVVFLPVRGRVEIYRDGKLLDAMLLEAGRQQIDTGKLPQGAYNLTIKVFDGPRLVNELRQLFVKSNRLPGRDDPIYFFEIGRPMENARQKYWPRTGRGWVGRGGYSFLLQNSTALSIASTINNSDALVETGLLHLGHDIDFSGGIMFARHNRQGLYSEVRWHGQGIQSQASYRELNHKKAGNSSLLEKGYRSGQFTISSVIQGASIELGRGWKKAEGDLSTSITDHARVEWPLLRGVRMDLRLSITGSRTKKMNQLLVGLSLARRTQFSEITFKQTRQETRTRDNQELAMASRVDGNLRDLKVGRRNSVNLGGFVERQRQQRSAGADMTFTGQRIGGRANISRTWPEKGENVTNYIGQFSTSLLASARGVAIGGSQLSDSAALVVLEGEGSSQFDILVNDRVVAKGQTGESVPVTLSPYGEYGISIRPAANSFSDYEERVQHVTLYPGNVAKVKFEATQVEPVLGRLQDDQGKAISGAVLENSQDKTVTDGRGLFQSRLVPSVTVLRVKMEDGQTCLAKLPAEKRKRRGVVLLGKLTCLPNL